MNTSQVASRRAQRSPVIVVVVKDTQQTSVDLRTQSADNGIKKDILPLYVPRSLDRSIQQLMMSLTYPLAMTTNMFFLLITSPIHEAVSR